MRDAIRFLQRNRLEVRRLRRFPGVERAVLDFGVEPNEDAAVHSWNFSEALVALARDVPLELEVSVYLAIKRRRPRGSNAK